MGKDQPCRRGMKGEVTLYGAKRRSIFRKKRPHTFVLSPIRERLFDILNHKQVKQCLIRLNENTRAASERDKG